MMTKNDFKALIEYEVSIGRLKMPSQAEIDDLWTKFLDKLNNDDYYASLEPESDAAYSYRDDLFSEIVLGIN